MSRTSASLPTSGVVTAAASSRPVKTQAMDAGEAPTACWMTGRAGTSIASSREYPAVAATSRTNVDRPRAGTPRGWE